MDVGMRGNAGDGIREASWNDDPLVTISVRGLLGRL